MSPAPTCPGRSPPCLAGAWLLEVFLVLPLVANVSLGTGAMPYGGQYNITARGTRPSGDRGPASSRLCRGSPVR